MRLSKEFRRVYHSHGLSLSCSLCRRSTLPFYSPRRPHFFLLVFVIGMAVCVFFSHWKFGSILPTDADVVCSGYMPIRLCVFFGYNVAVLIVNVAYYVYASVFSASLFLHSVCFTFVHISSSPFFMLAPLYFISNFFRCNISRSAFISFFSSCLICLFSLCSISWDCVYASAKFYKSRVMATKLFLSHPKCTSRTRFCIYRMTWSNVVKQPAWTTGWGRFIISYYCYCYCTQQIELDEDSKMKQAEKCKIEYYKNMQNPCTFLEYARSYFY